MSLPQKALRKINVDGIEYVWLAKPDRQANCNEGMRITIAPADNHKRLLQYFQSFGIVYKAGRQLEGGGEELISSPQIHSITNKLVRQIILAAIKNGWENEGDGVFPVTRYDQDVKPVAGTSFQLERILKNIGSGEYAKLNYLDIKMWSYSPDKSPEEFYHVFYFETKYYIEKFDPSEFYKVDYFIVKMLIRYARFLGIPHDKQKDFIAARKFVNKTLTEKETETYLLHFLKSDQAPSSLRGIKIGNANSVFIDPLRFGVIGRTENGLIGLIWDSAG